MRAIHQFIPTLEPGAVGNHCLLLRDSFRKAGFESEIFAEHIRPSMSDQAHFYTGYGKDFPATKDDILIYQMAVGSQVADFFKNQNASLVINHHNITPPDFFSTWEPGLVHGSSWGLEQLRELAKVSHLAIAVSSFNENELKKSGFKKTAVSPILIDLDAWDHSLDLDLVNELKKEKSNGGNNWLFVGRIVPNKAQHDIIKSFALYKKLFDPKARLYLVGSDSSQNYKRSLVKLVQVLGLDSCVYFKSGLSHSQLLAHYETADIFVCLSEHEGFCVPLVEAWITKTPVVAFSSSAIAETIKDAGLLLKYKDPLSIALAVERVLQDDGLHKFLISQGIKRLDDFKAESLSGSFLDILIQEFNLNTKLESLES